jgi:hypothetical protein
LAPLTAIPTDNPADSTATLDFAPFSSVCGVSPHRFPCQQGLHHATVYALPFQAKSPRVHWTCSITQLVIEQVLQNAPHFAVFYGNLFKN